MQNPDPPINPVPSSSTSAPAIKPSGGGRGFTVVAIAILGLIGLGLALVNFAPRLFIAEEKKPTYPALKIGGTSVIATIADNRWRTAYRKDKGIQIDYESTGSTTGVNNLIDGKYAIAFTHAPLSGELKAKAEAKGEILHIPVLLCGVAPVYNVKELKKKVVNFDGEVLAGIFLGTITNWNAKPLADLNPGLALPPTPIKVIHRDESSGTTYLLSEFLLDASKAWGKKYSHPSSQITWETGVGAARNLGIATAVYGTEGAIGYVDLQYTSFDDMVLDYGAVRNRNPAKPTYIQATPDSLVAAVKGAWPEIHDDLVFSLANKPGPDAYPIAGVVYAVCYRHQPDAQRQQVSDFLHWATHEGQASLKRSTYAPLPPELTARVDQRIKMIN